MFSGVVLSVGPPLTVRGHKLTSVGVGFDPSGTKVASGDMVGSVWVTQREQVTPLHKFSVSFWGVVIINFYTPSVCLLSVCLSVCR